MIREQQLRDPGTAPRQRQFLMPEARGLMLDPIRTSKHRPVFVFFLYFLLPAFGALGVGCWRLALVSGAAGRLGVLHVQSKEETGAGWSYGCGCNLLAWLCVVQNAATPQKSNTQHRPVH